MFPANLCSPVLSQLIELLHDLNEAPQISPILRYDLQPPAMITRGSSPGSQAETLPSDLTIVPTTLLSARQSLKNSRISDAEYRRLESSLPQSRDFKPAKSYASLLEIPIAPLGNAEGCNNAAETGINGFPSPDEEVQYLEDLDSYLNGAASTPRPFAAAAGRGGDRSSERDREMALKNPVSVYNWLRKHQPQVFLQDNEAHSEKQSTRPATSRASKRASTVKQEPDLYDEDGIALDIGSSSRAKRKRDDDGGYRPKGGNCRPTKRKKEDGSASAKKSKRLPLAD